MQLWIDFGPSRHTCWTVWARDGTKLTGFSQMSPLLRSFLESTCNPGAIQPWHCLGPSWWLFQAKPIPSIPFPQLPPRQRPQTLDHQELALRARARFVGSLFMRVQIAPKFWEEAERAHTDLSEPTRLNSAMRSLLSPVGANSVA